MVIGGFLKHPTNKLPESLYLEMKHDQNYTFWDLFKMKFKLSNEWKKLVLNFGRKLFLE